MKEWRVVGTKYMVVTPKHEGWGFPWLEMLWWLLTETARSQNSWTKCASTCSLAPYKLGGETAWHEPRFFGTLPKKDGQQQTEIFTKGPTNRWKKRFGAGLRFIIRNDQRVGSLYVMFFGFFGTCMTQPRRLALTNFWELLEFKLFWIMIRNGSVR